MLLEPGIQGIEVAERAGNHPGLSSHFCLLMSPHCFHQLALLGSHVAKQQGYVWCRTELKDQHTGPGKSCSCELSPLGLWEVGSVS